jgi:3-hydroxybutyryl-CoA dehydrogenase
MVVSKIVVIGAGTMGPGIAHMAALGGYKVKLVDIGRENLNRAAGTIRENLDKGVQLGKVPPEAAMAALDRLELSTDVVAAARDADLVIEAVPENLELKQQLFKQLDEVCPTRTIFASNTLIQSITEIGSVTRRQDRFIGMHFLNPAHILKLVEIVRGLETSEKTTVTVEQVARQMGKETVRMNDLPGFATSRISALIGNEAFYMLMEGVGTAEDIDKAIKLGLNHPMGPFELADTIGLDVRLRNLEHLHRLLGEKYRPCPLLVNYVKAGRLGRKTGRGVYDYTGRS